MTQDKSCDSQIFSRLGLKARIDLLQNSLAAWPRRGKKLLEINCGEGSFLPVLWECGFDVTATESDPSLLQRAVKCVGGRAEVLAASDEHLPFDDDDFDWVVLHVTANTAAAFEDSLGEAVRVAAGGLVVTFWNCASWPYLLYKLTGGKFWPQPRYNFLKVWHALKKYNAGSLTSLSVLSGSIHAWNKKNTSFFTRIAKYIPPLGAWCIIRMDIVSAGVMTFLPLRFEKTAYPIDACAGMSLESQRHRQCRR